ncbi:amidohydrolase family protein [Niabella sp. CC-SYL272]|uniref:amidohydrolase family protein n=1 Tax=Niabella agricola TaxID=2891571 RepID=UPI001F346CAB|nr:amidohydrolase family protein [Niabella agricola]MCF3108767.1 amidohydrolase family protein [Niabella agricola]
MLIDSNAYIGHWPFLKLEYNTPETLLGRMKEFGTDISVISNLNGIFYKNTQHANDELQEAIRSKKIYQDRFIPFAVINPAYGGWRDDLEQCITRMGMKGIRLYPQYHGYEIAAPACVELVKRCRDKGLPVAFCLRMVDSRTSSWMDLEKEWTLKNIVPIVKAVPDAKYLVVNAANSLALNPEEMDLFKKADLLIDSSGRNITNWSDLFKSFGTGSFCFGTHSPILDYFSGLLRIESSRATETDEKTKEQLRSGNLKRMLGI